MALIKELARKVEVQMAVDLGEQKGTEAGLQLKEVRKQMKSWTYEKTIKVFDLALQEKWGQAMAYAFNRGGSAWS